MAEVVVSLVVEQLVSAATEWLKDEASRIADVEDEIQNMSSKMRLIATLLEDAENQSRRSALVKLWLQNLKDITYDMEDVLDEWSTRTLMEEKQLIEISSSPPSSSNFTCLPLKQFNCFSNAKQDAWRRHIAFTIKDLNERVDVLFQEMERFQLVSKAWGSHGSTMDNYELVMETTSVVGKSQVHGRDDDDDKELLVSKMLEHNGLDVISIVGLGGIGKTTLAQRVFNDDRVKRNFSDRIWVCVSDPFDEVRVAKEILECLQGDTSRWNDLGGMHASIKESLYGKTFLLVLDDVWDEDFAKWERLRACLIVGAPGSKVLVTTRNEEVAKIMGTASLNIFKLSLLSDNECWLLISQIAFRGDYDSISDELEDIGKKIAQKCNGLPLAAKVIGGLMSSKTSIEEWKEVLHSEIWELEIAEPYYFYSIFLSYRKLPPALKRCFSSYAVFPKDFNLEVEWLTAFWVSHAYCDTRVENNMEQMGHTYFKYLAARCIFNESISEIANESVASMHDIMHDFARYITGDECLTIDHKNDVQRSSTSLNNKARHLYCSVALNPSSVCDVRKLRTCYVTNVPRHVLLDIIEHLKLARVLVLRDCDLTEVPEDVRKLIHLRLLDLSGNPLSELPEALCGLINLQHLFLKCVNLYVLPQNCGKLINLKFIKANKIVWQPELELLYKSITLRALVQIWIDSPSFNLGCLETLNRFQGALEICFASDYDDEAGANKAGLDTIHITELAFFFSYKEVSQGVIDALEPPPNLQVLHIKEFWGSNLPRWITSLKYLTELKVYGAANVDDLPSLGILPSLVKLQIDGFSALECISREFMGIENCDDSNNWKVSAFPKLVEFEIINCNELREWEDLRLEEQDSIVAMPSLEILHIARCPKLQELPYRILCKASLKKWSIIDSKLLLNFSSSGEDVADEGVIDALPLIPSVQVFKLNNVFGSKFPTWITSLNYLKELEVICAANVESLPPLGKLPSLEKLVIVKFSALRVIGREILGIDNSNENGIVAAIADPSCSYSSSSLAVFPKLVELEIETCYELKEWECPSLNGDETFSVMPLLKFLTIKWCPKLKFLPHRLLKKASSMEKLYISGCCTALREILEEDKELLIHIKQVKINGVDCSMHPSLYQEKY